MEEDESATGSLVDINALFLGPQSENREVFKDLIELLVDEHIHWRRNFHPEDEPIITHQEQRERGYEQTLEQTRQMLLELSSKLKSRSMPWFSPRYLGHMTYDPMMAANLAYFAALLYNPNNVAREGSPATTRMEVEIGQQFAELFDYADANRSSQPWGHITSGGTVANLEGLWIAKTMKSVPLAIRNIEQKDSAQEGASKSSVSEGHTNWELRNRSPTATLNMLTEFLNRATGDENRARSLQQVLDYSVRDLGIHQFATTNLNSANESNATSEMKKLNEFIDGNTASSLFFQPVKSDRQTAFEICDCVMAENEQAVCPTKTPTSVPVCLCGCHFCFTEFAFDRVAKTQPLANLLRRVLVFEFL